MKTVFFMASNIKEDKYSNQLIPLILTCSSLSRISKRILDLVLISVLTCVQKNNFHREESLNVVV